MYTCYCRRQNIDISFGCKEVVLDLQSAILTEESSQDPGTDRVNNEEFFES